MQSIPPVLTAGPTGAPNPQSPRYPASQPVAALPGKGPTPVSPAQLKAAVEEANRALDQSNQGFSFEFDDSLNGVSVKIIDKRTNTVVRLVPSEQMLRAAQALTSTSPSVRGALLTSKA